jgi:hypothetical protein
MLPQAQGDEEKTRGEEVVTVPIKLSRYLSRLNLFTIKASIADLESDGVGCFDPTKVILRLMDTFPEAIVCLHDYGWKDYDHFQTRSAHEGAIQLAESDARRRARMYIFRLRNANGQLIKGAAERYGVRIWSEEAIPAELKERVLVFLKSLRVDPIEVKSVKIDDNNQFPA